MKKTISATVDAKLADWLEEEAKKPQYRNKSHLIQLALTEFKDKKA